VAVILFWIKSKNWAESLRELKKNKTWWIFMAFYFFHILSLLWSENFKYAFFDLQVKLSYLLCPLVFAGLTFSGDEWKKIRRTFILGCALAAMICLCHSFWQFSIYGRKEFFFHDRFSFLMHPTYFMIYINLAMLFIFYELFWSRDAEGNWRKYYLAILFFLLMILFLLSARTALATALISFIIYVAILVRNKKFKQKEGLIVISFFGLAALFQVGVLAFYNRYDQVTNLIEHPDTKDENSASIRYHLWKIAAGLISEHPVAGVGIGDIKEELVKKYEANNYEYGIRNRISPHNQYLHTAVILGLAGVALLLLMFSTSLLLAWRNKDWIYGLFILIIALNAITESILERQAGILFFAFFNSLFASRLIGERKTEIL